MTLHAVLTVQGNLKGQGMAEGQCLALFNSLVLARMAPGFNPPHARQDGTWFQFPCARKDAR